MGSITIRGASDAEIANVDNHALRSRQYNAWDHAVASGLAFSWQNATYDYDANDTILGVENNSATRDLRIHKVFATGSTATQFVVFAASGKTLAGTAVTGVNLNRNSSNVADATAKADETGQTEQGGAYPTGLYSGRFANNGIVEIAVDGAIILPQDHMVGVDFTTNGTTANVVIWGYFVDRPAV